MARTMRAHTSIDEEQDEPVRRGRPSKHSLPFDSSVSDATVNEFCDRALKAKTNLEKLEEDAKTQRGIYRNVLKDAKSAGVDPDSITDWLKQRKREPDDITRDFAWKNRVYRLRGLPIGTQLGFDPETGDTVVEVEKPGKRRPGRPRKVGGNGAADARAAYIVGYDAGKAGKSAKREGKNFTGEAAVQFQAGWQQGQKDSAREHGPDSTMQ
jgi:hypothetical protein